MNYKLSVFIFILITGMNSTNTANAYGAGTKSPGLPSGIPLTYIYGYNKSLIIASVVNARETEVAYSSFESSDKGYWNYSGSILGSANDPGKTGFKYYDLGSGNIQRTSLPAGKYIISYWSKDNPVTISGQGYTLVSESSDLYTNGWRYYETIFQINVNTAIELSGNVKIDELRLHPIRAQMTTSTYDPLVGKTSETDERNITVYYEYDDFNRLKCVKDQFGNIRKNMVYRLDSQL